MRGFLGWQVRAGEGESEAEGYVLTNPVAKTSMSSGLSSKGKAQVEQFTSTVKEHHTAPLRSGKPCSSVSSHFRRNMQVSHRACRLSEDQDCSRPAGSH